jgi:hypothetical protein
MKRYQNISTVTTSVVKKSAGGDFKTLTVKPGQVIHVNDDDIEMTKDSYNPRTANPFDRGFIASIPDGKTEHPNAPKLTKNPTLKQAQSAIREGTIKKTLANITDHRGLVMVRRALESERKAISDSQFSEIDRMIDKQQDKVDRFQRDNAEKFGIQV